VHFLAAASKEMSNLVGILKRSFQAHVQTHQFQIRNQKRGEIKHFEAFIKLLNLRDQR
jgi:hypothetical protein